MKPLAPASPEGPRLSAELCPRVLPHGWVEVDQLGIAGMYVNRVQRLAMMFSVEREADGKRWMHVSVSHTQRIPTWEEMRSVQDWAIGRDKLAIQVMPPDYAYVNDHPRTLHLWHCLDGDPTPDFRHHGTI